MKKLYVIPFAGGEASSYRCLRADLISDYELVGLDYPGRGERKKEAPADSIEDLARQLAQYIAEDAQEEYAILGHSMGAYVAYEILRYLQKEGKQLPKNLILSGAPIYKILKGESFYSLKEIKKEDVMELVLSNGWMNEKVTKSKLFQNIIYKKLYCDLELMIQYKMPNEPIKESVSTSVLYGTLDKYGKEAYEGWQEVVEGPVKIFGIEGKHFFIVNQYKETAMVLNQILS